MPALQHSSSIDTHFKTHQELMLWVICLLQHEAQVLTLQGIVVLVVISEIYKVVYSVLFNDIYYYVL